MGQTYNPTQKDPKLRPNLVRLCLKQKEEGQGRLGMQFTGRVLAQHLGGGGKLPNPQYPKQNKSHWFMFEYFTT